MATPLPPDAQRLLDGPVDSFEKLEILVVLGQFPTQRHTPQTLSDQLRLELRVVVQCLVELELERLVAREEDGHVRLVAIERVASLLGAYDDDRLAIVTQISKISMERLRGMTARVFANAFDLRKKRRDEDG